MAKLKSDIIEIWYFKSKEDRKTKNLKKAVGYERVEQGILKKEKGKKSEYHLVKSITEVE